MTNITIRITRVFFCWLFLYINVYFLVYEHIIWERLNRGERLACYILYVLNKKSHSDFIALMWVFIHIVLTYCNLFTLLWFVIYHIGIRLYWRYTRIMRQPITGQVSKLIALYALQQSSFICISLKNDRFVLSYCFVFYTTIRFKSVWRQYTPLFIIGVHNTRKK